MNKYVKACDVLIVVLMLIALEVFLGKLVKADMWVSIAAYWGVLTIKNFCEWRARKRK